MLKQWKAKNTPQWCKSTEMIRRRSWKSITQFMVFASSKLIPAFEKISTAKTASTKLSQLVMSSLFLVRPLLREQLIRNGGSRSRRKKALSNQRSRLQTKKEKYFSEIKAFLRIKKKQQPRKPKKQSKRRKAKLQMRPEKRKNQPDFNNFLILVFIKINQ